MNKNLYENFVNILKDELVPALGCTEPIAIAFTAAKAKEVLGSMPKSILVSCSGNIVKNVKGVSVPNSGGLKGIEVAAILGTIAGDSEKKLEVLSTVSDDDRAKLKTLLAQNYCECSLLEGNENLNIIIEARDDNDNVVSVEVKYSHVNIVNITKNSEVIFSKSDEDVDTNTKTDTNINRDLLTVDDIIEFANVVEIKDIKETLDNQITMNQAISEEGIKNKYGASIGQTILKHYDKNDIRVRAKALASAGSDARMSGCAMPVVTNSGSGNQGLTVSIPVIEFAKHLNETDERLYRALVVSNLIAVLQKNHIGKLSAFCGAVCAAVGAATGIAYLHNFSNEKISDVITNTLCIIGGMVCDGAKPSCAAKIAQAIDCAIFSFDMMSKENQVFQPGDGLVKDTVEETIDSIGRMAKMGMERTDLEILNIMIGK